MLASFTVISTMEEKDSPHIIETRVLVHDIPNFAYEMKRIKADYSLACQQVANAVVVTLRILFR